MNGVGSPQFACLIRMKMWDVGMERESWFGCFFEEEGGNVWLSVL